MTRLILSAAEAGKTIIFRAYNNNLMPSLRGTILHRVDRDFSSRGSAANSDPSEQKQKTRDHFLS